MQLLIESDGTMRGTRLEFSMTLDEVPQMIQRHQRAQRKLRRTSPPDVVLPTEDTSHITNP